MVDRPGFAPGFPACKAGVLLLDDATRMARVMPAPFMAEGAGVEPARLSSLDALAPRCRRPSAGPSMWSRTRDLHPPRRVLQTRASLLGLCDVLGGCAGAAPASPGSRPGILLLNYHPHVSWGGRTRTLELRFQRPAFVPTQTTPHRMAP
jgi:hypothetical protein